MLPPTDGGRDISRKYAISVHFDPTNRILPYWATITHGIFTSPGRVWHARTEAKLIAKCEKWCRRSHARANRIDLPEIRVEGQHG